jgi:hypothetical protein
MKVTSIIFGDPVTPVATATQGKLENELITIAANDVTVSPNATFATGRMKVQWSVDDRPQKQVSRLVVVNDHLVAVHLDEKG